MEYQIRRKKNIFVEDNSIVTINSYISRDILLPLLCDMGKLLISSYISGLNTEFFFVFFFIFISWRLITLQYHSGFCHTST